MIEVTDRAAAKFTTLAEREEVPKSVRLGVQGGGCNGYSYVYLFDDEQKEGDHKWQVGDLTVRCDKKSFVLLDGCKLDFEPSLLRGGFRFTNPRARQSCSCGESFSM